MATLRSARDNAGAIEALRLLGAWTRLAQGHVALGGGCSCGGALGSIAVTDFERDIVDFLRDRHPAFAPLLEAPAQPIAGLLRALARPGHPQAFSAVQARALLRDLSRTIESFERVHAGV